MTTASSTSQSIGDLITRLNKTRGNVPPPLIGASTTVVGDRLFLYGGRQRASGEIMDKLYVLSLMTHVWTVITPKNPVPTPRYFHSATYYKDKECILFYGGLTLSSNTSHGLRALGDIFVLNLRTMTWEYPTITSSQLPRPRYGHLANVSPSGHLVILGGQDIETGYIDEINVFDYHALKWRRPFPINSHHCSYRTAATPVTIVKPALSFLSAQGGNKTIPAQFSSKDLQQKGFMTIFAYSNFNFYNLTRQLHKIIISSKGHVVDVRDETDVLIGANPTAPPALRFPSAFACGQHMVILGPNITPGQPQFHAWTLNVTNTTWTRLDPGPALAKGSWLRGVMYENERQLLIFGHPESSMELDYSQRLIHFDYMVSIDTEAFGIYQPPVVTTSPEAQQLGLSLLNNLSLSDLTIVTSDQHYVPVNSAIIAHRWPSIRSVLQPVLAPEKSNDPHLITTAYKLTFPDNYAVLIAFIQFIYTDQLTTIQQHQPRILPRLLLIAEYFGVKRLKELAVHALHQILNISTAPMVYEASTLAHCYSLQIRALRMMVQAKKEQNKGIDQHVDANAANRHTQGPPSVNGTEANSRSNSMLRNQSSRAASVSSRPSVSSSQPAVEISDQVSSNNSWIGQHPSMMSQESSQLLSTKASQTREGKTSQLTPPATSSESGSPVPKMSRSTSLWFSGAKTKTKARSNTSTEETLMEVNQ